MSGQTRPKVIFQRVIIFAGLRWIQSLLLPPKQQKRCSQKESLENGDIAFGKGSRFAPLVLFLENKQIERAHILAESARVSVPVLIDTQEEGQMHSAE